VSQNSFASPEPKAAAPEQQPQDGHLGDYVLWLVIGVVLLGAGLVAAWRNWG
jgi:hypothetical protein